MKFDTIEFVGPYRAAQLRFLTDDGAFYRTVRNPGDDITDIPDDTRKQIEDAWTPEVVAAYAEATKPEPAAGRGRRRRVDRLTIIKRLDVLGLLNEAEAAILAAPAITRWRWNIATEGVYADDPETIGFLQSIGANPDVILAP